jgi:hypothetical protein
MNAMRHEQALLQKLGPIPQPIPNRQSSELEIVQLIETKGWGVF